MAAVIPTAPLGTRGAEVTRIGLGCAPLGNLFTALADDDATATIGAAWDAGIRFFDTAPLYGHGLSEQRLGRGLQKYPRDSFVVSSKVGRVLKPDPDFDPGVFRVSRGLAPQFDYSRDGVLRSIEESLGRLGLDRLDIVLVHDPDDHEREALDGAFPALLELRDQGVVRAVGAGMNQHEMLDRFVTQVDLDCVLLAGRYTLLDRTGAALLDVCAVRGVGVILGGVFNSGILANVDGHTTFDYEPASAAMIERAAVLRAVCDRHEVSLPAAALGFALRRRAVSAVVVGARTADEIRADVAWAQTPVPPALLDELDAIA
jgi:Predicted oxidoreductases (related to aryl-alcohol dehydrogenases)